MIKKKINFFPIYKEIQSGAVAKLYMRKGFPIYEEMLKYFPIYKEAVSHLWLCNCSVLNFLIYGEILIFFFISEALIEQNKEVKGKSNNTYWHHDRLSSRRGAGKHVLFRNRTSKGLSVSKAFAEMLVCKLMSIVTAGIKHLYLTWSDAKQQWWAML